MNELVASRLEAIQSSLMIAHKGGAGLPSALIGSEREQFINLYLEQILPPIYRFGRGSITDVSGGSTGQLDIVMELPFSPSFPLLGARERLYLAESVACVIEVKSNLGSQWGEIERTAKDINKLTRELRKSNVIEWGGSPEPIPGTEPSERIPCYAVGYTGHKSVKGLIDRIDSTPMSSRPDGSLVIDSGCFVGPSGSAKGVWGLYAFVSELVARVNSILGIANPDFYLYGEIDRKT